MDLHALLNPATALDCNAKCIADGESLAVTTLADSEFEGQLVALVPADTAEVGDSAPEPAQDNDHAPLPAPDPITGLIETLTGISAAMPVQPVTPRLSDADSANLAATLPVEGDGLEVPVTFAGDKFASQQLYTATSAAPQPASIDPAGTDDLWSPARQTARLNPDLPPQSPPSKQMQADASKATHPDRDRQIAGTKAPNRSSAPPKEDGIVIIDSPSADKPALLPAAKVLPAVIRPETANTRVFSPETHKQGDNPPRPAAESAEIALASSLPVSARTTVTIPATGAHDPKQAEALAAANITSPPPEENIASFSLVETPKPRPLPAFRGEAHPDLSGRNTPNDALITTVSTPELSVRQGDGLQNALHSGPLRESATATQTLLQPEARTAPANPASIIRQVADAIVTTRNDTVEITLSPEELGRVRMVLTGHERAPHLVIWAERPDILEQMRRNADLLMQEFSDEGFSDATLSFEDHRQGSHTHHVNDDQAQENREKSPEIIPSQMIENPQISRTPMTLGSRRIDIRI